MTVFRGGACRLSVVLGFVLLCLLGQPPFGAPDGGRGAGPGVPSSAGPADPGARFDTDGSSGVLPSQPRIHVLVNRGIDRTGVPAPAAAVAAPPMAGHTGSTRLTAPAGPSAGGVPAAGSRFGRAPPPAAA